MALLQTAESTSATTAPQHSRSSSPSGRPIPSLLSRLGQVAGPAAPSTAEQLRDLEAWVMADLRGFEAEMDGLVRGESAVEKSAHHLLDLGGKRVRPLCVVLASRMGTGFSHEARQLAMAVELVHSATLLHDDVVDLGDTRRGHATARVIYGNAASIFAGDWLLVEALRRVSAAAVPGLLDNMLSVIQEMILAESIQLEARGRINAELTDYFRVVEGKTASLFRWAMLAGAKVGGLGTTEAQALERYGHHLGIAFQAVDDLLDINGNSAITGKALFTDLREGKMTYPLIIALERDPSILPILRECAALPPDQALPAAATELVVGALVSTGALEDCRKLARTHSSEAIAALSGLPDGPGKNALIMVAEITSSRDK